MLKPVWGSQGVLSPISLALERNGAVGDIQAFAPGRRVPFSRAILRLRSGTDQNAQKQPCFDNHLYKPKLIQNKYRGRVGQGVSPSASHGTVLESLNSYGSYCPYRPISQSVPMHK